MQRRAWQVAGKPYMLCVGKLEHLSHPALYITSYLPTDDGAIAEHRTVLGFFKSDASLALLTDFLDEYTEALHRRTSDGTT